MSETKLQYQQRMQRKFERQSEDNTRLTNELAQLRSVVKAPITLPEVEKWRSVDQVRSQMAYRRLVAEQLRAAGFAVED